MEAGIIARSYAAGLYALAEKHRLHDEFVQGFAALDVIVGEPIVRTFLASPKIDRRTKKRILRTVLTDRVPPLFLNFVLVAIDKRRQGMFAEIANAYRALVDEAAGRLHVQVTVAREPAAELEQEIRARLTEIFGKNVIPHVTVDQNILGGIIVRQGDVIIDGSLRRRLLAIRRRMLTAQ